jgi:hypothetical protein
MRRRLDFCAGAKVSEEPSAPILENHNSILKMEAASSSQMLVKYLQNYMAPNSQKSVIFKT